MIMRYPYNIIARSLCSELIVSPWILWSILQSNKFGCWEVNDSAIAHDQYYSVRYIHAMFMLWTPLLETTTPCMHCLDCSTGTRPGQKVKCTDCPSQNRTVGNYGLLNDLTFREIAWPAAPLLSCLFCSRIGDSVSVCCGSDLSM